MVRRYRRGDGRRKPDRRRQSHKDRKCRANGNDKSVPYSSEYSQNHEQQEQDIDAHLLPNSSFAAAPIVLPSACPASCLVATPITFPISAGDDAPVSAMIFAMIAFNAA